MELKGVVQNGVIVPDDATALPEGTRVRITPAPPEPVGPAAAPPDDWRRGILATAGKWQGDFQRPEQGEYEQRVPLS